MLKAVEWKQKKLTIIDQNKLPDKVVTIQLRTSTQAIEAIKLMKVRGAIALGCLTAFTIYLGLKQATTVKTFDKFFKDFEKIGQQVLKVRPGIRNIEWAIERMTRCVQNNRDHKIKTLIDILLKEAVTILKENEVAMKTIVATGIDLIRDEDTILVYGNVGSLATAASGSVLSMIKEASADKKVDVLVPETRPSMDGARLTALELKQAKIPFKLITESMIAHLMKTGVINIVVLGADRITMSGDVFAQIGTYGVVLLAYQHNIPVYFTAVVNSFDRNLLSGDPIKVDERKTDEVLKYNNKPISIPGIKALNPVNDITPHKYISAIVTDLGIVRAPFDQNLRNLFSTLA